MRYSFLILVVLMVSPFELHAKELVGWIENAVIYPGGLELKAKIDTGAQTSSMHSEDYKIYDKHGKQWIRFSVTNFKDEQVWFDKKVYRIATIRRHFGKSQERPVVLMGVCLGGVFLETEVNLVDRGGHEYKMLVGRSFLKEKFLVDSGAQSINPPHCTGKIGGE